MYEREIDRRSEGERGRRGAKEKKGVFSGHDETERDRKSELYIEGQK